ncbi:hypothetical protein H0O00_04865 [Candidatus Micrarchaeota archaeon]|nr:hypothetical protein [Candidatus Micrarchaeota archaeon]
MDIHANARRIGNSWGIIIPKEIADVLGISKSTCLHVSMEVIPEVKEIKGTFRTKKTIAQLSREIDRGWD